MATIKSNLDRFSLTNTAVATPEQKRASDGQGYVTVKPSLLRTLLIVAVAAGAAIGLVKFLMS